MFAIDSSRGAVSTVAALKSAAVQLKAETQQIDISELEVSYWGWCRRWSVSGCSWSTLCSVWRVAGRARRHGRADGGGGRDSGDHGALVWVRDRSGWIRVSATTRLQLSVGCGFCLRLFVFPLRA